MILDEDINNSAIGLDNVVKKICEASERLPRNSMLQMRVKELLDSCPESLKEFHFAKRGNNREVGLGIVTESSLVKLNKELKSALIRYKQAKVQLSDSIPKAIYLEDIAAAADSPFKRVVFTIPKDQRKCMPRFREAVEWHWLLLIKPMIYKGIAVLFFCMSVLVVLGECTLFITFPIGAFPLLFQQDFGIASTQILCLIPLSYIVLCTYYGMFQLKLPGWYGIYPKNTDPSSLVYCAFYLSRLSAPLAYNFFLFAKVKNPVFFQSIGVTQLVMQASEKFAMFFPLLLVVFCGLNLMHTYGRVLNLFGMNQLSYIDGTEEHQIFEGKSIIKREKVHLLKNLNIENKVSDWELMNIDIMRDASHYTSRKQLI